MKMLRNEHKPGNMAVLVQAPRAGLRTFEDTLEASVGRKGIPAKNRNARVTTSYRPAS
jgi:hypothetical protein